MSKRKKLSYYLGTDPPAEKGKNKYKSDPRLVIYPAFRTPLYKSYDLYENDSETSPGGGIHAVPGKYKSVQEFLAAKRKRNKDKYVREEQEYYPDNKPENKKSTRLDRKAALEVIKKTAQLITDVPNYAAAIHSYPVDDIFQDSSMNPAGTQIGGMYDYLAPRLNVDSVSSIPIGWIRENHPEYDENFTKFKAKRKEKKQKRKIQKIHGLLDRMVGRSYSGYPIGYGYGYGGYGRGYSDNRDYITNNYDNSPDPSDGGSDGGGDSGGDGGGGE